MGTPRFLTHESEGRLGREQVATRPGGGSTFGITVTVHDRLHLYRVVGLFRSEEASRVPGFRSQTASNQARRAWVREQGRALAEELNANG